MKKLRVLSLFSGIGAFEQGLKNIGMTFDLVNYCDFDKYASKSYSLLYDTSEVKNLGDITKIDIDALPEFDLLTHGSPCQSFSSVGKQEGGNKGSGTKSSLMWNTVEVIKHRKPKYVIWENVKNLLSESHKHNFDQYISELNELGYTSSWKLVNSNKFNIPQNRERVFVVSVLNENKGYVFPSGLELKTSLKNILEVDVDDKYTVPKHCLIGYQGKKSEWRKRFKVKDIELVANCLVAKGGRAVITNNYIFKDLNLYKNPPCEFNDLDYLIDKDVEVRALTPREYWRLQGFSDTQFDKVNGIISDAQLYKQAGNSITVDVTENIFKELFNQFPFDAN